MDSKGIVLVTGASGYIAGFILQQLSREGWTVRGTVRNLARADEVRSALGLPDLQLFQADLTSDAGWAEAVAGCDYVQHIASPIPDAEPKDENDLIVPAREGALRALRFAHGAGVKRVVMTSSMAAIAYGHPEPRPVFTEQHWTDPANPDTYAYIRSKTYSERAARDWMAASGAGMEYVSVNPAAVLGPVLGKDFSTSLEIIKRLLDGALPGLPNIGFGIVDVRDVADLHVRVMTAPGMDGERFIACGKFLWFREVADVLKARLGTRARRVPTRRLPDWLLRIVSRFDATIRMVTPELGKVREASSAHAMTTLGWTMRPEEQTIVDCANSLIEKGLVKS
ncbi:aldehyde reductase [Sandarakinorhabdus sp.]|uniref:SDR family oxidoreductase n=1 Tax=Sandarakinorhabdus sp. TaxID=1916663 RepID=UPI00286E5B40|nr:aldehyde reductase [Sandarakinorhabdus sp.]